MESDGTTIKEAVIRLDMRVEERFDQVRQKFEKLDQRYASLDGRSTIHDDDLPIRQHGRESGPAAYRPARPAPVADCKFVGMLTTTIAFGSAMVAALPRVCVGSYSRASLSAPALALPEDAASRGSSEASHWRVRDCAIRARGVAFFRQRLVAWE
jgi:hypothetical protein